MKSSRPIEQRDCGPTLRAPASPPESARLAILCLLVLLWVMLTSSTRAANPSTTKESAAVADTVALQMEADSIEKVFTNAIGKLEQKKENKSSMAGGLIWLVLGGGLLGFV